MLAPTAQTEDVLDACEPGKQEIEAAGFARRRAAGECPIEEHRIVNGGVGSVVPEPGESMYAEILTTSWTQELEIRRRRKRKERTWGDRRRRS